MASRSSRLRYDSPLMSAHETMVDFLKGNLTSSVMDMLGGGILGFLQNLELDEDRDLIYSDEEDDDFIKTQELKPHPRIRELDDEEADQQIKESTEEEEKRKSKTIKNKRKKMRKKEKKRQEKVESDQKLSPEEEQQKSFSESEEENNNDNYKELAQSTTDLSNEPYNLENKNIVKEENPLQLNIKKDDPPKNLDLKKSAPCIIESVSEKKTKNNKQKNEKTQTTQNKKAEKVKQNKKEEPKEENSVKAEKENGGKGSEMQKEEKLDENKEETTGVIVDEYAKKSREMAAIGNRLAANGRYEMAIKCFTEAIKLTPKEYKLFGNRSFCFEKMQLFEQALSDAEVSLSLEPNWTKGLFRKGKAECGLKKYYNASLTFAEVLKIDSTSQEAIMELKRAQTLHLMEMGFTWAQCTNALKSHATLEEAVDALFTEELESSLQENGACKSEQPTADQTSVDEEWKKVKLPTKSKQQTKEKEEPLYPVSKKQAKLGQLFPVWVGSLSSSVSYATLHEVFSRVGKVFSIKMVLEHQCAFVNYTTKMDCEQAIQLLNGKVLEGRPLVVRYPSRLHPGLGASKHAEMDSLTPPCIQTECFFWRTNGCTKDDCTYKHVPKNKGIDQEKFGIKGNHY